ncbi:hypothetical protein M0805_001456 [Coniferiporia weirii]|nr:hypothetical protein M0805_001456 [Coniferiporia weirii]
MANVTLALSFQPPDARNWGINAEPSVLSSWGFGDLEVETEVDDLTNRALWGAVVGCMDGSLYIFRPDLSKPTKKKSTGKRRFSADGNPNHLPYRRAPHLSLPRSSNASPSASKTSLHAISSSKSRAISGLSKEQVEAPKNFVDFEDEQEKMKGMIADRGVRDVKDRSPRAQLSPTYDTSMRRMDDTRSLASVESSSSMLSPPLSPNLGPQRAIYTRKNLLLRSRIIPGDFGFGHAVVALRVLEEGELVLSLQESGKVSLFKTLDGACVVSAEPGDIPLSVKPTVISHRTGSQALWAWRSLHVSRNENSIVVVAVADADIRAAALDSSESDGKTRVVLFELSGVQEYGFGETTLAKIGDLTFEGRSEGVAFCYDSNRTIKMYLVDSNSQLLARTLTVFPELSERRQLPVSTSGLSLPQSFRDLVSRSGQPSPSGETSAVISRVDVQAPRLAGTLPLSGNIMGLRLQYVSSALMGSAWSEAELVIFSLREDKVIMRCIVPVQTGLKNVDWLGENSVRLSCLNKIETYALPDIMTNGSHDSIEDQPSHTPTRLLSSMPVSSAEIVCTAGAQLLLSVQTDAAGQRIVILQQGSSRGSPRENSATSIWCKTPPTPQNSVPPRITSILPLRLASIIVGYSDGHLRSFSTQELVSSKGQDVSPSADAEPFSVLSLFLIRDLRTNGSFVVGGGDDGSIGFWELSTLELKAQWIIFTEPLAQVIQLENNTTGRLKGCCLCISQDGTIAVIAIEGFSFICLIPGSPARLQKLSLSADNLLLFYADGRTRLWDMKTREFRRSMSTEKAAEMLAKGDWFSASIGGDNTDMTRQFSIALNKSTAIGDPSPVVLFDVPAIIDGYTRGNNAADGERPSLEHVKALLGITHTPGLDEQLDRVLSDFVGPVNSNAIVGSFDAQHNYRTFCFNSPGAAWQISPDITASRLLTIVAILRVLVNTKGYEKAVNTAISFYTAVLPLLISPAYEAPSLVVLARHWNESSISDIRHAAKHLFENEVSRLPDYEITATVEAWQHRLPCLLPDNEKQSAKAALALSICGNIATEKYSLLSSTTLADIAKSVTIYLYDETSPHRSLAIELCSRGFEVWQQYFDAMEALRSLFTLATASRKETISVRNPGPQARMAVLQIASSNSPLFMTTLSLDILHPHSIEYSRSVLQIIAFLIRKKPFVLYPNLPRLMEAVVKSLDPGSNADREAVLDTVTEIIALVVQTFPTVDFHAGSQRLAVGTSEGAVVMYDLKTATRLYVLEGHRKQLAGISFSPDGRRMVTLSVEESAVLVWKVGTSFTSFFNPGAPPRQGRSGSDPYKTLNFVLKDEAIMTVEATLKQVRFDWPSDRSVRVEIRDAKFTFST